MSDRPPSAGRTATGASRLAALLIAAAVVLLPGLGGHDHASAAPPAPAPLAPADGASGVAPFTISWSPVLDPAGINGYNWQVSPSLGFTPVIRMDSTRGDETQDVVSGLPGGSYFWRVQAANGAGEQGAWSTPRLFTVTGVAPGTPGTPVLAPLPYSTFHPFESIRFNWSAATGAVTYRLEISTDPSFPLGTVPAGTQTFWFDNIPGTVDGFTLGNDEGNYFARVFAVNADNPDGVRGLPSNTIQFSVFYRNPVQPPPSPLAPVDNPALTLPVTLTWTEMAIPQPMGYDVEVSGDSSFATNEVPTAVQLTNPTVTLLSLTGGPKFWRVRSTQGMCSPLLPCFTAWSPVGTFTISTAPPTPVSILPYQLPVQIPLHSGTDTWIAVQLTSAVPPSGATIALTTSHPGVAPVPPSIAMQGGHGWTQFFMSLGDVTSPTVVTLTATLNGVTTAGQLTVLPPELASLTVTPGTINGGAQAGAFLQLKGRAPPGGAVVSLSSSSPAASVPASVTIPAGSFSLPVPVQTGAVTTDTTATITATWNGVSKQAPLTVTPQAPVPTSLTLFPAWVIGGVGSSTGSFTIAEPTTPYDRFVQVSTSHPDLLPFLSRTAIVPAGATGGNFSVLHNWVTVPTVVTISVTGGGVSRSAQLTVNPDGTPPPPPALSSFSVSPSSVSGGSTATGTVRLPSAAPAGGTVVTLGSNLPGTASVPPSVTVPAGATSATFTVTTFLVAPTTAQLTARLGDTILFAPITVNSPATSSLSAVSVSPASVAGGTAATGTVTLSAATPTSAVVSLSDNSSAVSVPASVTVPAGASTASFTVTTSAVTATTPVVITAAYGGTTQTAVLTLTATGSTPAAPSLSSPASGATVAQPVTLDWSDVPTATAYEVQVDSSSTIAAPFVVSQIVTGSQVTLGGLPAQRLWWRVRARNAAGVFGPFSSTRRFTPQAAPAAATLSSLAVSPASLVGPASATGTATLSAAAPTGGAVVALSSSSTVAGVPASVTVPAGATSATFTVTTTSVTATTSATLTGAYAGTSRTATLSVTAVAAPATLSTLAVTPASVSGATTAQGTVTLTGAAPVGGAVVSLSSSAAAATVPATVTVAAGATSAGFTVTAAAVTAVTPATISATLGGTTRSATLTLSPPGAGGTLTVTATGRSGERVVSSPAGINVAVGSTGSAAFAAGTSVTLSVSNGRDAVWSGACSSGGSKTRSCTLTITGSASVTANVQ